VRALLDLMREHEATVQTKAAACVAILVLATLQLKVLDPEVGEEELIKAVAEDLAKLRQCEDLGQLGQDELASG